MVTEVYGSKILGRRLQRARLAAGYRSAAAAAAAHGWHAGSYSNLERGQRSLSDERAAEFAKAFGVPSLWLTDERASLDAIESALSREQRRLLEVAPREDIAGLLSRSSRKDTGSRHLRLRAAREMAGFGSVAEAALALGIARTTYIAHEAGSRGLSPQHLRYYAIALGVREDWLAERIGQSGLPVSDRWVEDRWNGDLTDLKGAPEADPTRVPPRNVLEVARRIVDLKAGLLRSGDEVVAVPEIAADGSAAFRAGIDWSMPTPTLLRMGVGEGAALVAAPIECTYGGPASVGELALVDIRPVGGSAGDWIVCNLEGKIAVVPDSDPPGIILGFYCAQLMKPASHGR